MGASTLSDAATSSKLRGFQNFTGIDRSRSIIALERPESQPLWECEGAICDYRGIIVREPELVRRKDTQRVDSLTFYSKDNIVYAESNGSHVSLNTDRNHRVTNAYPEGSVVSFEVFRGNLVAMSPYQPMYLYDGAEWKQSNIDLKPAFGTTAQGRFFVAGMPDRPREVISSRLADITIFADNDESAESDARKAGFIDISNQISTSAEITGIGSFESNRLAIFTEDQVVIYVVDTDYRNWRVDDKSKVKIGCISGRSVVEVGTDLAFCSRHGVHMLQRSRDNGITVVPLTLSENIEKLYKSLLKTVPNPALINSCYDQDEGSLHIFFPQRAADESIRLTYHFRGGYENAKWSMSRTVGARCGEVQAGRFVLGGYSGLWNVQDRSFTSGIYEQGDKLVPAYRAPMRISTPILWMGDILNEKQSLTIALQAVGTGDIIFRIYDQEGRKVTESTVTLQAPEGETDEFPFRALERTYTLRFQSRFKGLLLEIESLDDGDIEIISFALELGTEKKER